MPRKPRFYVPETPVHVVQRGNNRQTTFFAEADYLYYLKWLAVAAKRYQCAIHAYSLMPNHIHLLLTPSSADGVSKMMQYVGRYYVAYINQTYHRSGALWEGRYKSCLIDAESYFFICSRYIELNPLRSGLVEKADLYAWSSYHANVGGVNQQLLTPHALYVGLANSEAGRKSAYQNILKQIDSDDTLSDVRAAWQSGTPLGSRLFLQRVEEYTKQQVGYKQRGRPRKEIESAG